jgi:hypothetical protein
MREQPNYTCKLKNLLKLYCIWTWDTWWGYFCACVYSFVLLYASPLMRKLQNNIWGTISRIGDCDFTAFELGGFLVFLVFLNFLFFHFILIHFYI